MPELKKLFEDLGFKEVQTYIQSGNVIFRSDENAFVNDLSLTIELAIKQTFGYAVPVVIRTPQELAGVMNSNPFHHPDGTLKDNIYVTFLEKEPLPGYVDKINPFDYKPDRFFVQGREIYIDCAAGYGTTRLSNTFFENKLKVRATTRNWKTVITLLQMTKE
jgi:uncharacterized protein (DUF1697 family)